MIASASMLSASPAGPRQVATPHLAQRVHASVTATARLGMSIRRSTPSDRTPHRIRAHAYGGGQCFGGAVSSTWLSNTPITVTIAVSFGLSRSSRCTPALVGMSKSERWGRTVVGQCSLVVVRGPGGGGRTARRVGLGSSGNGPRIPTLRQNRRFRLDIDSVSRRRAMACAAWRTLSGQPSPGHHLLIWSILRCPLDAAPLQK